MFKPLAFGCATPVVPRGSGCQSDSQESLPTAQAELQAEKLEVEYSKKKLAVERSMQVGTTAAQ